MSFSNIRMSSEFSSELSSTVNSASLLPGNSDSSAEVLKATWNTMLLTWRCIHVWPCSVVHKTVPDLTSPWPLPPLRKYPASQLLCFEPQHWALHGRVSGDRLLVMEEPQTSAHTALTGGHTWQWENNGPCKKLFVNQCMDMMLEKLWHHMLSGDFSPLDPNKCWLLYST